MAQRQQQRRPRGLSAHYANEAERLQEILHDKTVLALPLVSKDNWIKNDERPHCYYCQRTFRPPFVRKHHCRGCGEVVCRSCNRHRKVRIPLRVLNVRLCFDCIDKAMIGANKTRDASFGAARADEAPTPDCNFMSTSSADTMSSASSAVSMRRDGMRCDSSSSGASSDAESDCSDQSRGSARASSASARRSSRVQRSPTELSACEPIEFLPKAMRREIYDERRQELLALYGILDTRAEPEYDALCELASRALECTVAAIGFLDVNRQWYKARISIAQSELPRHVAFCAAVLDSALPTVVMDASVDPRFRANPLVSSSAHIRFYASAPICDPATGIVLGSVFVMDRAPKQTLPPRAMEILAYLSTAAEKLLLGGPSSSEQQQTPLRLSDNSQTFGALEAKRQRRVHSAPATPNERPTLRQRKDVRAASLQCVPEELEPKDDGARSVPALSRSARERELYRLIDPHVQLPAPPRLGRRNSEGVMTAAPRPSSARPASVRKKRAETVDAVSLVSLAPEWSELSRLSSSGRLSSGGEVDSMCLDLLCRITSTQELLAQQQSAFFETLAQHSSRIGSIEQCVDRIQSAMHALATECSSSSGEVDV